ncbi:MAG: universal stress protein [Candidatus Obscuribacterales bacterium]|nr:universal stress protein [Candidatus Obscuribacterales bacterium]
MKILIAIDDSPYSEHILELVSKRKWPLDCQFKILTVIEPFTSSDWQGEDWSLMNKEITALRRKRAGELCAKARKRLENYIAGAIVHYEIREGQPGWEIVMDAADWNADKIIIGAHGRNVCPHNLLGSVSRTVSEHAPCSVEVIRSKNELQKNVVLSSSVKSLRKIQ